MAGSYSEPSRTSKMELFAEIVNGWNVLTIFAKNFILDVWMGSEYAFVLHKVLWLSVMYFGIYYVAVFLKYCI